MSDIYQPAGSAYTTSSGSAPVDAGPKLKRLRDMSDGTVAEVLAPTVQRFSVTVTTDGAGAATAYSDYVTGKLSQIRYVKTDYDNGSTFTITADATGETLWTEAAVNASATRAPRQATHTTAGAAALYAAAGTAVNDKIGIANDRIKIVIASGGATKTGVFHFILE